MSLQATSCPQAGRLALIAMMVLLLCGCFESTTLPDVDGGVVGVSGRFVDMTGADRGVIRVELTFEELDDLQRFPESRRPWLVVATGVVSVSSAGDDPFMSTVAAGLEGGSLLLKYQELTPGVVRVIGQITVRQPEALPVEIAVVSEFSGRTGSNGVPAVDDLVNLLARIQIKDGGVSPESTIECSDAVLSIRGVGTLAQQVE